MANSPSFPTQLSPIHLHSPPIGDRDVRRIASSSIPFFSAHQSVPPYNNCETLPEYQSFPNQQQFTPIPPVAYANPSVECWKFPKPHECAPHLNFLQQWSVDHLSNAQSAQGPEIAYGRSTQSIPSPNNRLGTAPQFLSAPHSYCGFPATYLPTYYGPPLFATPPSIVTQRTMSPHPFPRSRRRKWLVYSNIL
eukprot:GHVN01002751.1.p1 GENE.GHVN01002751.1~~GHVN01002751.1.p1  ORF type:complete len:193 (+),score=16.28 GHVN01002751.1:107-685(+)